MTLDYSIARWTSRVPVRQWTREQGQLEGLGSGLPEAVAASKPLAQAHRLDLALFVVFEEVALRVSGALTRGAPSQEALTFAAQQTLDEARHHEMFRARFLAARAAAGISADEPADAILIPPLKSFMERCYEVADSGSYAEGLALVNLILEGMAYPLYAYEERYWKPVDPYLAALIHSAFVDETRHVHYGAALVKDLLARDPGERARVARMAEEARGLLAEVFGYYVRTLVRIFDAAARQNRALFGDAELAPGRRIADTPYEEQLRIIQTSIDARHRELLESAALA